MKHYPFFLVLLIGVVCAIRPGEILAQAQTTSINNPLYTVDKTELVLPSIAVTRLETAINTMKVQMAGLSEASSQYKQLKTKSAYYDMIRRILLDEKAQTSERVSEALIRSLGLYASDVYSDTPQGQRRQNKDDAVALLKL